MNPPVFYPVGCTAQGTSILLAQIWGAPDKYTLGSRPNLKCVCRKPCSGLRIHMEPQKIRVKKGLPLFFIRRLPTVRLT